MYLKGLLVLIVFNLTLAERVVDPGYNEVNEVELEIQNAPDMNQMIKGPVIKAVGSALSATTILGLMMNNYKHVNVSEACQLAMANLTDGLNTGSMTALTFVDATAKIPSGITEGTLTMFGSYDQCLDLDYPSKSQSNFYGKYCSVNVNMGNLIGAALFGGTQSSLMGGGLRFDVCLPHTCTEQDIDVALNNILALKMVGVTMKVGTCDTRIEEPYNTGQIVAIVVFSILGFLLLSGTLVDIFLRLMESFYPETSMVKSSNSVAREVLLSFSMYTNGVKLLNTHSAADSLTAVNGIRFMSMSWVIICHAYMMTNLSALGNVKIMFIHLPRDFFFQAIMNGTVSVDSFFFLSGLLVTYVAMKGLARDGKINWGMYYFHRVWRLTPAYAAVVLFTLLFPLLGSGPTWKRTALNMMEICQKNWWSAILYINNFYKSKEMCVGHGWYLANDMQFYIVSPIILISLYKKAAVGLAVNFAFLLASIVTPAVLGAYHKLPYSLATTGNQEASTIYFQEVYIKPWCRMGPYCVGIFVGYYLSKKRTLNLGRLSKTVIWCLAIACNMSVLYGVWSWSKGNQGSYQIHALYLSTSRTAWALGLAWVVLTCATGNGGVVNSILSWKLFVPLGRMTYLAYLIHPMVEIAHGGIIRERIMYTHYSHVTMSLGLLLISYGFAFAASLAVEAPFLGLEKVLLKKPKRVDKPEVNGNGLTNAAYTPDSKL